MDTKTAQEPIDGLLVARMIQDFWRELEGTYGKDVMTSSLCAVGPLQSMIGLAIRNGHIKVATEQINRNAPLMQSQDGSWISEIVGNLARIL